LLIEDYDIHFEDKASEPMPRDHMNEYIHTYIHTHIHTHIPPIQKFTKITVRCGIYHKHTKYVTYRLCTIQNIKIS